MVITENGITGTLPIIGGVPTLNLIGGMNYLQRN